MSASIAPSFGWRAWSLRNNPTMPHMGFTSPRPPTAAAEISTAYLNIGQRHLNKVSLYETARGRDDAPTSSSLSCRVFLDDGNKATARTKSRRLLLQLPVFHAYLHVVPD